jgi:hypothetical protein
MCAAIRADQSDPRNHTMNGTKAAVSCASCRSVDRSPSAFRTELTFLAQ